jgi:serine/threonine-protein kinase
VDVVALSEPIAGRYRLSRRLGGGGMAEVYDAIDLRLDRPVAVKVLRDGLVTDRAMVRRAEAEAQMAAKVDHPNVVAVLDAGRVEDTPFVVMERLPGLTLRDRLREAPLEVKEIREIGRQVLDGLAAAHDLGLVHRDLKPSNILVGPRNTWKIADFGIATWLTGDATQSASGELLGSAPYLAPERVDGSPATYATDIYAVGVVLYECATGRRPVERDDPVSTLMAIRDGAAEPLRSHRPHLEPALRSAIERAIAHDPAARWASASDFARALSVPTPAVGETVRLPDADPAATEPIPSVGPTERLPSAEPHPSELRPAPIRRRRRADPSRALGIVLGGALALILAIAIATMLMARADEPTSDRPSLGPSVPTELRDSLDELGEAIEP